MTRHRHGAAGIEFDLREITRRPRGNGLWVGEEPDACLPSNADRLRMCKIFVQGLPPWCREGRSPPPASPDTEGSYPRYLGKPTQWQRL